MRLLMYLIWAVSVVLLGAWGLRFTYDAGRLGPLWYCVNSGSSAFVGIIGLTISVFYLCARAVRDTDSPPPH